MFKIILFISLVCYALPLFGGEVYKTEENDGKIIYTNIKPDQKNEKIIETRNYSHHETKSQEELNPEPTNKSSEGKKQYRVDEIFREKAELLYEREQRLVEEIEKKEKYIDELDQVIEDYLVNGYFADRYVFELKVQKTKLEKLRAELGRIDNQWYQLKKEARKNSVNPGVLRVR